MKKLVLVIFLYFSMVQLYAQLSWQSRPSFPGPSRHHAIGFSHGSKGYVMTGEDSIQFQDFWEYDTLTNMWTQLPDYPGLARSYGVGAVVNDTAYIGFGYSDTTFLTDWWAYDFSTSTWSQKDSFPGAGRNHPTCAAANGKVYMGFGDNATGSINDWWEYNPVADSWLQKTNYPGLPMHHPVTCTDSILIYLSEGHLIDSTTNYGSVDFYSYNSTTDHWDTLADMPGPGVVAGATFNLGTHKIYSGAGITEPNETWHKEFYEYDIATNTWDTIADYAGTGVFGPVSFNIGHYGYVATGYGTSNTTQDFFVLAPMLRVDAGLISIETINNGPSCNTTFAPVVTLKNFGIDTLMSCTINYQIDAGTVLTYTWTGSLATLAGTQVTLPMQTVIPGTHIFTCFESSPNGISDPNGWNDQSVQEFLVFSAVTINTPVVEGFDTIAFPPHSWQSFNPDGNLTWERMDSVGGFGNSFGSVYINCYNYSAAGENDYLYTPPMDFSSFLSPTFLTFSVAYVPFDTVNYCEALDLDVSTDCGLTWTNVYFKSCLNLATDSADVNGFVPDSSQWRTDSVDLNAYVGDINVIVRFKSTNHYGNNLYLDDINFHTAPNAVKELGIKSEFILYPNPTNDLLSFSKTLNNVEVYNVLGELIIPKTAKLNSISTVSFPDGIYFVKSDRGVAKVIVKH